MNETKRIFLGKNYDAHRTPPTLVMCCNKSEAKRMFLSFAFMISSNFPFANVSTVVQIYLMVFFAHFISVEALSSLIPPSPLSLALPCLFLTNFFLLLRMSYVFGCNFDFSTLVPIAFAPSNAILPAKSMLAVNSFETLWRAVPPNKHIRTIRIFNRKKWFHSVFSFLSRVLVVSDELLMNRQYFFSFTFDIFERTSFIKMSNRRQ